MIKSFLAFLGGEPGEEKPMLLLLGMGFFMGVFISTYQIGSESLFLNELGDNYLDKAFFTAGGLGIISTVIFVWLQKRINYSTLITTNMFLIFLFMGVMRAAFTLTGYESQPDDEFKLLPFLMFVMIGPITAITLLGFWGLFGRMFDLRASKRIIGGIDTGALTSTIIAFFSIPFITQLPFINETYDLLLVSAVSSFGVFIFTIWIVMSFNVDRVTKIDVKKEDSVKEINFFDLIKDPYLRLMTLFLMFSMGASVFVDFTFYSATEIMYPDEQELTNFLSFFSGTVMLMSFVIQSFLNDIIIGRFGLKVALMTMPIILILFTIGGIISGHIFGFEVKSEEFILFFMFTATAKAFTASLKDALESPAFKLFFLPIDIKIRFDIQTRIEGVASEFATLLAGALQIGLGLLAFFKLIHFSYFILGLAGMIVWLVGKLLFQYKAYLKDTLERQKKELKGDGKRNEENTLNILKRETKSRDTTEVINGLRLLENIDPIQFEYVLLDLLGYKRPVVRIYAYNKLREYLSFQALEIIQKEAKTEGDEGAIEAAKKCIAVLQEADNFVLNDFNIRELIRSTDAHNRIKGARLLTKVTEDRYLPYVLELLRDINPEVRAAAMMTSGKLKRPELLSILVENMHNPIYANISMSALGNVGENAFHILDTSFYKTGQFKQTMVRIVQLMGRIGGRTATDLLWKKIDFPDKAIVSQILLSFSYIGLEARDFQSARIKIIIESEIGDIAWNLKAVQDIPEEGNEIDKLIKEAFKEEDNQNYENIFMLLSMIYDPQNVLLVKDNIQNGTSNSITFAVEMLDIFVEDEMKPKVIPIMDDLKAEERLARLNNNYPPENFESYNDLLLQVINRDYNRINRYTKALSIYRVASLEGSTVSDDLIANLFNPDPLLLQTAAWAIYKLDINAYQRHSIRLKPSVKKELDKAIVPPIYRDKDEDYHQKKLLIERVLFLKQVKGIERIPGELITYIGEALEEIRVPAGSVLIEESGAGDSPIYFILNGNVDIYLDGAKSSELEPNDMFGYECLLASEKFGFTALSRAQCTLLVLKKANLLDLLSRHKEIMEVFVDIHNGIFETTEIEISDILLDV